MTQLRNVIIVGVFFLAFLCFLFAAPLPVYYYQYTYNSTLSHKVSVSFFERCPHYNNNNNNNRRIISEKCQFLTLEAAECEAQKPVDTLGKIAVIGSIVFSGLCLVTHLASDNEARNEKFKNSTFDKERAAKNKTEQKKEETESEESKIKNEESSYYPMKTGCIISAVGACLFSTLLWVMCVVEIFAPLCNANAGAIDSLADFSIGSCLWVSVGGAVLVLIGTGLALAPKWGKEKQL